MKILAITACTAGVAHTYMAAEALEKAAKEQGIDIHVETQGAMGIENEITPADVTEASAVIFANEIPLMKKERFKDLLAFKVSPSDVIKNADKVLDAVKKHVTSRRTLEVAHE